MNKLYGHYSEKQAARIRGGTYPRKPSIYSTPEGGEVVVTEVTLTEKPSGNWDDYESRGQVVSWLGRRKT